MYLGGLRNHKVWALGPPNSLVMWWSLEVLVPNIDVNTRLIDRKCWELVWFGLARKPIVNWQVPGNLQLVG